LVRVLYHMRKLDCMVFVEAVGITKRTVFSPCAAVVEPCKVVVLVWRESTRAELIMNGLDRIVFVLCWRVLTSSQRRWKAWHSDSTKGISDGVAGQSQHCTHGTVVPCDLILTHRD
jgi:hypothetical protein